MRGDGPTRGNGPTARAGPVLRLTIEAEACAIRHALAGITAALGPLRLSAECLGDIELVLAEVFNNIQRHAYGGGPGLIDLAMEASGDRLVCRIADSGRPMPGGQLPAGEAVAVEVRTEALPEGGFGWFLIRTHAELLDYRREGGQNRLTFHLPLRSDAAASRPAPSRR